MIKKPTKTDLDHSPGPTVKSPRPFGAEAMGSDAQFTGKIAPEFDHRFTRGNHIPGLTKKPRGSDKK